MVRHQSSQLFYVFGVFGMITTFEDGDMRNDYDEMQRLLHNCYYLTRVMVNHDDDDDDDDGTKGGYPSKHHPRKGF